MEGGGREGGERKGGREERGREGGQPAVRHEFTRAVYILTSLNIHWLLSCLLTAPHKYCIRL